MSTICRLLCDTSSSSTRCPSCTIHPSTGMCHNPDRLPECSPDHSIRRSSRMTARNCHMMRNTSLHRGRYRPYRLPGHYSRRRPSRRGRCMFRRNRFRRCTLCRRVPMNTRKRRRRSRPPYIRWRRRTPQSPCIHNPRRSSLRLRCPRRYRHHNTTGQPGRSCTCCRYPYSGCRRR